MNRQPTYPSDDELKATRTQALVAFTIIVATIISLTALVTLELAGAIRVPGLVYVAIFATSVVLLILALTIRPKKRSNVRNLTAHPPTKPLRTYGEAIDQTKENK